MSASSKKTVLITGCSAGGIGAALAKEFHSRGFRVFAVSRRLETMEELPAIGIETLALDVTNIDAIRKTKEEISRRTGGKLDILVNNAGQVGDAAVADMDMAFVRSLYELNVFGPMCMVQEFLPLLIASGKGCVVNHGSVAGVMPLPFSTAYNSSKAALLSFGNTLRIELAPFNVRVVNLITGGVATNILQPYTLHPFEFSENSLYKSMQEQQQTRLRESLKDAISAADFARTVVGAVTKSAPPRTVWAGAHAMQAWMVVTFLPSTIIEWIVADMFGISKLAARLRSEKRAHT